MASWINQLKKEMWHKSWFFLMGMSPMGNTKSFLVLHSINLNTKRNLFSGSLSRLGLTTISQGNWKFIRLLRTQEKIHPMMMRIKKLRKESSSWDQNKEINGLKTLNTGISTGRKDRSYKSTSSKTSSIARHPGTWSPTFASVSD